MACFACAGFSLSSYASTNLISSGNPSEVTLLLSSGEGESDAEGEPEAEEVEDLNVDLFTAVNVAEASTAKDMVAPRVKHEIEAT